MNFPTATDIKVSSINFKTIVDWSPKPTNFTYTVQIRGSTLRDWKKKCIYTTDTTCDVSDIMQDARSPYEIRIISEVKSPETDEEFPHADGPTFNPYEETLIGKPVIQEFKFNKDHSNLTIVVKDALTPYRNAYNTPVTVRDIFQSDFRYTVFYRKASSTGKKEQSSASNKIVIKTEKGEDYCFFVQATVPSRKENRASQNSDEKCTSSGNADYDITILVAVGTAAGLIVLIIVLSVVLCKCRNGKKEKPKEKVPLNDV
ncbi:hypothetical protein GDO78_009205 [Eleutherodactylus coqui]|uniref:Tissue factor n=1 Tax=Eleutherodactylus coqui TaxID=57060 RepID=A0A8J6F9S9_ELECQ|nr:hypothetical protein GDO78_009205 [Eleutherodactylus coqui]